MISRQKKALIAVIGLAVAAVIWRLRSDEPQERAESTDAGSSERSDLSPPSTGERSLGQRIRDAVSRGGLEGAEPALAVGTARVEGVVRNLSGAAVEGVDVLFRGVGGEASATSDGSGEFALELGGGTYDVRAIGDRLISRNTPSLRVIPATDQSEPQRIEVVVEQLATLSGRVVDHNGSGVDGATVHAIATSESERQMSRGGLLLDQVPTESGGDFEIDALAKKELVLEARSGHLRARLLLANIQPGETRGGLVIALTEAIEISGTVVSPDGAPVGYASVNMIVNTRVFSHSQQATSDASGRFAFEPMTRGSFTLEARADGFGPSIPLSIPLREVKRGASSYQLTLQRGNVVSGVVVDQNNNPVPGVRLRMGRGGSSFKALERYTNDRGEFEITGVDRAKHWMSAVKGGYATTTVEGLEPPRSNVEVTLLPLGSIRGQVTEPSGQPMSSFVVTIDQIKQRGVTNARKPNQATRFSGGRYELAQLEPGRYDLTVSAGGHRPVKLSIEVPPGEEADGSAALAASE